MKLYKPKKGFTLVEALILLLAMSIILAATMPIISKKHSQLARKVPHGKYICYKDASDNLHELLYKNNTIVYDKATTKCVFQPPSNAAYFLVHAVGGGGGGGGTGTNAYSRSQLNGLTDSGTMYVSDPEAYDPGWVRQKKYEANTGYLGVTVYAPSAGAGGDYTFTPDGESTATKNTGGAAGTGSTYYCNSTYKIKYTPMTWTTAPSYYGCRGSNAGPSTNPPYDPLGDGTDGAENGTAGTFGSVTVEYNGVADSTVCEPSDTIVEGGGGATSLGNGADASNPTPGSTNYLGYCAPSSISPDVSNTSFNWYVYQDTKAYKYGTGGGAGEYASLFVTALKRDIEMRIGSGGTAGVNATGVSGGDGGWTYFGPLASPYLKAKGGTGGVPAITTSYVVSPNVPNTTDFSKDANGYITKLGGSGSSSIFSAFTLISGISASAGLENDGNYGSGGKGGSTVSKCNSTQESRQFNGVTLESYGATCTDSQYEPSGYDYAVVYGSEPQKGYGGAIIIVW